MYTPTFDELAGGEEDFFAVHWSRAPLYRAAVLERSAREILSIADLDAILCLEAIRPPYLRIMNNGVMIPNVEFTATTLVLGAITDTVVPEKVLELLRAGATITWPAIDHFRPNLRALAQMLATKFAAQSAVTAVVMPTGGSGLDPQHGYFDMFAIQLEGTSRWTLWPVPPARRPEIRHYMPGELGEPVLEVSLGPGDVLYLPWGTPHVTAAEGQVSLHLSVMVRVRLWTDLLALTVQRLLDDPAFWQFPYLTEATAASQEQALANRAGLLARRLAELDPAQELRRLIDLGRRSLGSSHATIAHIAASARIGQPHPVDVS